MTSHAVIFLDFSNFSTPGAERLEDIPSFPEWEYQVNRTNFPIFSKNFFSGRKSNERTLTVQTQDVLVYIKVL